MRGGSESHENGNQRRGGETNDEIKKGKTAENMREKERRHQETRESNIENIDRVIYNI